MSIILLKPLVLADCVHITGGILGGRTFKEEVNAENSE